MLIALTEWSETGQRAERTVYVNTAAITAIYPHAVGAHVVLGPDLYLYAKETPADIVAAGGMSIRTGTAFMEAARDVLKWWAEIQESDPLRIEPPFVAKIRAALTAAEGRG